MQQDNPNIFSIRGPKLTALLVESMRMSSSQNKIEMFRNAFVGERCFILGGGPSLRKADLRLLRNEISFGVNGIFYLFDEMGFKPTFYVVEDTLVAEDRSKEINALRGMVRLFGNYLNYCLDDHPEVAWMNVHFDYSNYAQFPFFSCDASKHLWVGGTVTYLCMQLAYYMGFENVYLLGFDHNYSIPKTASIEGTVITSSADDPNHFHPAYFGKGKRWHDPRLDRMEMAYRRAHNSFNLSNKNIFNATEGGNLEVFPRIPFEEVISGSKVSPSSNGAATSTHTSIPLVSVVVCTYQNADLLDKTLKSLDQQTLSKLDYEVIVVDNNSSDHTKQITEKYPNITYVFEAHQGLSIARNTGIMAASGNIIAYIDDDAEASPQWLQQLIDTYRIDSNIWVVGGRVDPIWDCQKPGWWNEKYYVGLSILQYSEGCYPLECPQRLIGTNISFRKESFIQFGMFDVHLGRIGEILIGGEEVELQKRMNKYGYYVYYNHEASVGHHIPETRVNKNYLHKRQLGHQLTVIIQTLQRLNRTTELNTLWKEINTLSNSRSRKGVTIESLETLCNLIPEVNTNQPYIEDAISSIPSDVNQIVVYGAGELFEQMYPQLVQRNIAVTAIIDKRAETGPFSIMGIEVLSMESVFKHLAEPTILIASKAYCNEIEKQINEYANSMKIKVHVVRG